MAYSFVGFNGPLSLTSNAILTQQLGIQSTAANIANANAPGYHRNDTIITSGGAIGGVEQARLVRATNTAIEQQQTVELGKQAAADNRSLLLQSQVKPLMGTIDQSLSISGALGNLFNSLQTLSENPASTPARNVVLKSATVLTDRINTIANNLVDQQTQLNSRSAVIVQVANNLLDNVADLNNRITSGSAAGIPTGDLEDQRSNAANDLAKLIGSEVLWDNNGQMRIIIAGGVSLVSSVSVSPLALYPDATSSSLHIGVPGTSMENLDSQITRGEMGAIIQVRDTDLPNARLQLDTFATNLATQFNAVHSVAYATDGAATTGTNFFTPVPTAISTTNPQPTDYANNIAVNPDILNSLNAALLAVAGNPTALSGDNGGVAAMLALNTPTGLQKELADVVTSVGSTLDDATDAVDRESAFVEQLYNMVQSQTGVNIEEQLLQLSRFQTAFSAATRIVSTVDQMLQALLSM